MSISAAILVRFGPGIGLGGLRRLRAVPDAFFVFEVQGLSFEGVEEGAAVLLRCVDLALGLTFVGRRYTCGCLPAFSAIFLTFLRSWMSARSLRMWYFASRYAAAADKLATARPVAVSSLTLLCSLGGIGLKVRYL